MSPKQALLVREGLAAGPRGAFRLVSFSGKVP